MGEERIGFLIVIAMFLAGLITTFALIEPDKEFEDICSQFEALFAHPHLHNSRANQTSDFDRGYPGLIARIP